MNHTVQSITAQNFSETAVMQLNKKSLTINLEDIIVSNDENLVAFGEKVSLKSWKNIPKEISGHLVTAEIEADAESHHHKLLCKSCNCSIEVDLLNARPTDKQVLVQYMYGKFVVENCRKV